MRFLQSKYSALSALAVQAVDLTFGPLFMKEHIGKGILCTRTGRSILVQCVQVQDGAYWYSVYSTWEECLQGLEIKSIHRHGPTEPDPPCSISNFSKINYSIHPPTQSIPPPPPTQLWLQRKSFRRECDESFL